MKRRRINLTIRNQLILKRRDVGMFLTTLLFRNFTGYDCFDQSDEIRRITLFDPAHFTRQQGCGITCIDRKTQSLGWGVSFPDKKIITAYHHHHFTAGCESRKSIINIARRRSVGKRTVDKFQHADYKTHR